MYLKTDAGSNIDLLRTLTVVSEVIWKLVGITYSIVKHRPFSSPGTDEKESCDTNVDLKMTYDNL